MSILLTNEEITKVLKGIKWGEDLMDKERKAIAKAQLKKAADAIESMTADGWLLEMEEIVGILREEVG